MPSGRAAVVETSDEAAAEEATEEAASLEGAEEAAPEAEPPQADIEAASSAKTASLETKRLHLITRYLTRNDSKLL